MGKGLLVKEKRLHGWWVNYDQGWVGLVFVAFPGWKNHEEGPDFLDGLLKIDGRVVRGDVEIHRTSKDWYAHGHHRDPRFNRVILHVVGSLEGRRPITTQNGRVIPSTLISAAPLQKEPNLPGLPVELLDQGGRARLRQKVARMRRWAVREGLEGALYRGLLDAYGYAKFRKPFRKLADAVPWRVAGSLSQRELNKRMHVAARFISWRGAFVRPFNRPERRINELVEALGRYPRRLSLRVTRALRSPRPRLALIRIGAPATELGYRIVVNVLLPWLMVAAELKRRPLWADLAHKWYREWPPLSSNAVTRRVARQVFGHSDRRWPWPMTALRQQGLHWLDRHPELFAA